MRSQRTKLSLHIRHPTRNLLSVCQSLGLQPKIVWKKGDERQTPKGTKTGGTRENSYCAIDFGAASKVELSEKIEAALRMLKRHRALLRRLHSTGGRASFYIGWFCKGDTGEELGYKVLAGMADLCIALDLNIYVPDSKVKER
jgi:uncharacterized protein DUF4279